MSKAQCPKRSVQHPDLSFQIPASSVQSPESSVQSSVSRVQRLESSVQDSSSSTCVQTPGIRYVEFNSFYCNYKICIKWDLKELWNGALWIIRVQSLFCSIQIYVSLHFLPILLKTRFSSFCVLCLCPYILK